MSKICCSIIIILKSGPLGNSKFKVKVVLRTKLKEIRWLKSRHKKEKNNKLKNISIFTWKKFRKDIMSTS